MPFSSKEQPKSSLKKDGRIAQQAKQQQHASQREKKLLSVKVTVLSVAGLHIEESTKKSSYFNRSNNGKSLSEGAENDAPANPQDTDNGPRRGRGRSRSRSLSLVRSMSRGRSASRGRSLTRIARSERGRSKSKRNKIMPIENDNEQLQDPTNDFGLKDFDTTTVVASVTKKGNKAVHVKSLPIPLPTSSAAATSNVDDRSSFNEVVCWPSEESKLSSFTFKRYFPLEPHSAASKRIRYAPQLCPIEVSLMSKGKMHKLGSAHVYVGGEENGQISMNVPLIKCEKAFGGIMKKRGNHSNVSMMKIKGRDGTTIKCGLEDRATLRVLIEVSEPKNNTNTSSMQKIQKVLSFENDTGNAKKVGVQEPSFLSRVLCCCQG